jgi:ABC-type transport system involved in multi-copper enzyme maturation permease subunit
MMFQPNPVAMRESRAMWRGARSFLLLGLYTGALALVAYLAYSSEVRHATAVASFNGEEIQVQSARVGRSLFTALSYVQVVAWLLISPALTATSISSERERGLLESLLMSYLKPRQIVAGKFSVCASFVALLIVATLPVLAICFLLGGVSPGEFTGAFLIQATTAFCAMSLGVWCSAGLRLSTHALGATFGGFVVWTLASMFLMTAGDTARTKGWPEQAARTLALCNPLFGMWALLEPTDRSINPLLLEPQWRWTLCVGAQVLAGAFFLFAAARRIAAPLEAEEEPRRKSKNAAAAGASTGASTWGELEERAPRRLRSAGISMCPSSSTWSPAGRCCATTCARRGAGKSRAGGRGAGGWQPLPSSRCAICTRSAGP